jgi:hypothetical protein
VGLKGCKRQGGGGSFKEFSTVNHKMVYAVYYQVLNEMNPYTAAVLHRTDLMIL